jgi:hypothetical protein
VKKLTYILFLLSALVSQAAPTFIRAIDYPTRTTATNGDFVILYTSVAGTNFYTTKVFMSNLVSAIASLGGLTNLAGQTNWTVAGTNIVAFMQGPLGGSTGNILTKVSDGTAQWQAPAASGVTNLNGLAGQSQTFRATNDGNGFSLASSGTEHVFKLNWATNSRDGILLSNDYSAFRAKQPGDTGLTNLAGLASPGLVAITAADSFTARSLEAGSNIAIQFANGASGDPIISAVGLQGGSLILTNLSGTGAITNAPWTNSYQPASLVLTNLSGTGALTNAPWTNSYQAASTILTNLSGTGAITNAPWTNSYQPASAILTNLSGTGALTNATWIAQFSGLGTNTIFRGSETNQMPVQIIHSGLGSIAADGLTLTNSTAAAAGAQQYSPALRLTGQGWKTDATAASQSTDWRIYNQPVQEAANPTANLLFDSSINGAAFVNRVSFTSGGTVTMGGGNVIVSATGNIDLGSVATITGSSDLIFTRSGTPSFRAGAGLFGITSSLGLGSSASSIDIVLIRDAANVLAQRNSTAAQTFRLYNTYTDASNYERGFTRWTNNVFEVGVEVAGTGTSRSMQFLTDGTARWNITTNGHFLAATDNTYDFGDAGATGRPRIGYFATSINVAGAVLNGAALTFSGRTILDAISNGNLILKNNAGTSFDRLQFGGTTPVFPAWQRKAAGFILSGADGTYNSTNNLIVPGDIIATNNLATYGGFYVNNTVDTTPVVAITMNKPSGRVRISAAGQSIYVTNSIVTANSIVVATINSVDSTATSVQAIPAAGLLRLRCNAVTTADTDISFLISSP